MSVWVSLSVYVGVCVSYALTWRVFRKSRTTNRKA